MVWSSNCLFVSLIRSSQQQTTAEKRFSITSLLSSYQMVKMVNNSEDQ